VLFSRSIKRALPCRDRLKGRPKGSRIFLGFGIEFKILWGDSAKWRHLPTTNLSFFGSLGPWWVPTTRHRSSVSGADDDKSHIVRTGPRVYCSQ
jgi:hypothetical protein